MKEAEVGVLGLAMVNAGGIQKLEGAHEVRHDEFFRGINGTIHVRLCRKVHDGIDLVLAQQITHELRVLDVALNKDMTRVGVELGQTGTVSGVGELIEVHHLADGYPKFLLGFTKKIMNKVRANKARAASNENALVCHKKERGV